MKGESLYHLLQIRARKLEEGADADLQRQLRAVQAELRVSHSRGWFEVSWRHDGRDFSLNVPEHDFTFYVAGDTGKAVEQRGTTGNVRQRNWEASAALWQRLAEVSGFSLPALGADDAMGLTPAVAMPRGSRSRQWLVGIAVTVAGTLLASWQAGWIAGFGSGLVALLLTGLAQGLEDTQLGRPFSLPEIAIAAAGTFLPAWFGGDTLWLACMLAGLALLTWMESSDVDLPAGWGIAGILLGVTSYWVGLAAVLLATALCGALVVLRLLAPRRLSTGDVAWCIGGAVIGLIAGLLLPTAGAGTGEDVTLPTAIGILLLLAFGLWSFHGLLFQLLPWLAIGTLGLGSLVASLAGWPSAGGALALAGFTLVIVVRLATAFARATTPRPSSPLKD